MFIFDSIEKIFTMNQQHFFEKNYSLTEWFEQIENYDVSSLRQEDNDKRERLKVLSEVIGLPTDKPYQFLATEVDESRPDFQTFLQKHGDELCAIRLMPFDPSLPKLRIRGESIRDSVEWFKKQDIERERYKVDFVPHCNDTIYSTIFVVNEYGIFGELVCGAHSLLSQGNYTDENKFFFSFDFTSWTFSKEDHLLVDHITKVAEYLCVKETAKQNSLKENLQAIFSHNYLHGYFETTYSKEYGVWFIDYNRILGKNYQLFVPKQEENMPDVVLKGQIGNPGIAQGQVRIVSPEEIPSTTLTSSEILICDVTDPSYLPLMKQAAGFITNRGGILSHAAIVAREMGKPCLVGTKNATEQLKNGESILLDANKGIVQKI